MGLSLEARFAKSCDAMVATVLQQLTKPEATASTNALCTESAWHLRGRTVHVWSVRTRIPDRTGFFQSLLAPDERDRAARYRFAHLRDTFSLTRGILRLLLGKYLHADPSGVRFAYGAQTKPRLAGPEPLHFSISHSGDIACFAFSLDCELGIDVEAIRPLPDMEQIARRFFCASEAEEIASVPLEQRTRAFFLCWTRKEAYIKALGGGLSVPLDSFRVTLQPGESARLIYPEQDAGSARSWTLHDLSFGPDFAAALAYRDAPRPVHFLPIIDAIELLDHRGLNGRLS